MNILRTDTVTPLDDRVQPANVQEVTADAMQNLSRWLIMGWFVGLIPDVLEHLVSYVPAGLAP